MQGRHLHPEFWEERGEGTPSCYPERTSLAPRERPCWPPSRRGRKCSSSCAGHFLLWEAPWGPSQSPQLQFPPPLRVTAPFLPSTALTPLGSPTDRGCVIRACLGRRQVGELQLPHHRLNAKVDRLSAASSQQARSLSSRSSWSLPAGLHVPAGSGPQPPNWLPGQVEGARDRSLPASLLSPAGSSSHPGATIELRPVQPLWPANPEED